MNIGIVIREHRAKFVKREFSAVLSQSLLAKEYGAFRRTLHQYRNDEENRRQHNERGQASKNIDGALQSAVYPECCASLREVHTEDSVFALVRKDSDDQCHAAIDIHTEGSLQDYGYLPDDGFDYIRRRISNLRHQQPKRG